MTPVSLLGRKCHMVHILVEFSNNCKDLLSLLINEISSMIFQTTHHLVDCLVHIKVICVTCLVTVVYQWNAIIYDL